MRSYFDMMMGITPLFVLTGIVFWIYLLQERVSGLEKRVEELMNQESQDS